VINGRVASGQWQRLHTGVFATFSGPVPRAALLWGAVLRAGDDAVLSHHTAAEVWNLTDQSSSSIHVSVPRQAGSLVIPGLVLHYSSRLPGARHPARMPPQTTLEETVLDLADVSPTAEDAVAWAIKACQRRLSTPDRNPAPLRKGLLGHNAEDPTPIRGQIPSAIENLLITARSGGACERGRRGVRPRGGAGRGRGRGGSRRTGDTRGWRGPRPWRGPGAAG